MYKILLALGVVLLVGATASAQWYQPEVVTSYYPAAPVYAPVPYAVPAPVYATYYAPPVVVAPRVAYMPVGPVVVGPPAVVRAKVYYPGRPIRNTVRWAIP